MFNKLLLEYIKARKIYIRVEWGNVVLATEGREMADGLRWEVKNTRSLNSLLSIKSIV